MPCASAVSCACTARPSTASSRDNASSLRVSKTDTSEIRGLMGPRTERLKRAAHVGRVARRGGLLRVLRELGVWGNRPATREGALEFRRSLEELGTTYIKLGQLLSSRPDLLPDVYIEELSKLVDEVPPVPFEEIRQVVVADLPADAFVRIDPEPLATASIAQIHA